MAKKKSSFGFDIDSDGDDDVLIETSVSSFTVEVPEGLDGAIYRQGYQVALADAANDPPTVTENYFAEGTPQADSWAAGYAAAVPPLP